MVPSIKFFYHTPAGWQRSRRPDPPAEIGGPTLAGRLVHSLQQSCGGGIRNGLVRQRGRGLLRIWRRWGDRCRLPQ